MHGHFPIQCGPLFYLSPYKFLDLAVLFFNKSRGVPLSCPLQTLIPDADDLPPPHPARDSSPQTVSTHRLRGLTRSSSLHWDPGPGPSGLSRYVVGFPIYITSGVGIPSHAPPPYLIYSCAVQPFIFALPILILLRVSGHPRERSDRPPRALPVNWRVALAHYVSKGHPPAQAV